MCIASDCRISRPCASSPRRPTTPWPTAASYKSLRSVAPSTCVCACYILGTTHNNCPSGHFFEGEVCGWVVGRERRSRIFVASCLRCIALCPNMRFEYDAEGACSVQCVPGGACSPVVSVAIRGAVYDSVS